MRGAWVVLCICACGGSGEEAPGDAVVVADAVPDASFKSCEIVSQTGCSAHEKCTWARDASGARAFVCAPLGEVAIDESCAFGSTEPYAYDNCVKGSACVDDKCRSVCGLGSYPSSCDVEHGCITFPKELAENGAPVAGVCQPACDPLTQVQLVGNKPACDSPNPANPTRGCYQAEGFRKFVCGPAAPANLTDGTYPQTGSSGRPAPNGCAPGFVPVFYESPTSMRVTCNGTCAPLDTDNTRPQNALGDPAVLGKLPLEPAPVAGNATCEIGKKGSVTPMNCRYIWRYLYGPMGQPPASPYNDTLGVCYPYSRWLYDQDGDGTLESPEPGCENLPPRSASTPKTNDDAIDWACYSFANTPMFTATNLRLGYTHEPLARHSFR